MPIEIRLCLLVSHFLGETAEPVLYDVLTVSVELHVLKVIRGVGWHHWFSVRYPLRDQVDVIWEWALYHPALTR